MKLELFAVAVALALSSPAVAATTYDAVDSSTSIPAPKSIIDVVYPSLYANWLTSWQTAYEDLYGSWSMSGDAANFSTSFTSTISSLVGAQSQSFVYSINKLSGTGASTVYSTTASYQTAVAVQAVPGPEAGAGIGALALGGMALWMKRRRMNDAQTA
jgi:opacity protein-like surface antigen